MLFWIKSQDEPPYNKTEGEGIEHKEENLSCYSRSPLVDGEFEEKNERYHSLRNAQAESGKLDVPHSIQHSHSGTCGRPASLGTGILMLVSPLEFPHVHQSLNGHSPLSLEERGQDHLYSHTSHIQKHSSSSERSDLPNQISFYNHLSPTATQTSVSSKQSQQGYHQRNGSEPHYSPEKYGRHYRSISMSPIQQRDPFSEYGRDYRERSCSRSPYTTERYRSPRRRSPRQKSPSGYHSHHYSPIRRSQSPPSNRRTGLGKPGRIFFVAGYNLLTTERVLERKFSRFGSVRDVRIVQDKRSWDSRGFGFLALERDEDADADAAIRTLDETEWNGRIILVEIRNLLVEAPVITFLVLWILANIALEKE